MEIVWRRRSSRAPHNLDINLAAHGRAPLIFGAERDLRHQKEDTALPIPKLAFAFLNLIAIFLFACSSISEPQRLDFEHDGNKLAGTLLLPQTPGPHPVVIFVHGDGATTWDAYGYYRPFMTALKNVGYAVYSWDKPGVGGSSGNWLDQSLSGRADELQAAAETLRRDPRIRGDKIGLLGFSQAGWVMPKAVANDPRFAFMISISGAINWLDQSDYMTKNRFRLEGASDATIERALAFDRSLVALMEQDADYDTYQTFMLQAPPCCQGAMSEARWNFVKRNFRADARADLSQVNIPVLAVFGDRDMNVDYKQSMAVYKSILPQAADVLLLSNADHSLLPASEDRLVTAGPALTRRLIKVDLLGAAGFAGDAVKIVAGWASDQ